MPKESSSTIQVDEGGGDVFDGTEPIYLQIAAQIRQDILAGHLKADQQVMSTTQYAAQFRINPATAAKAFALLTDEGLLYKKRGLGMFVTQEAQGIIRAQEREVFFDQYFEPMIRKARMLGIEMPELIQRLQANAATEDAR